MTTDDLRAAGELATRHERFAPWFGRTEARAQSRIYWHGLLAGQGRKSAEPMALAFGTAAGGGIGPNPVLALQRFLTYSPWDALAAPGFVTLTRLRLKKNARTDSGFGAAVAAKRLATTASDADGGAGHYAVPSESKPRRPGRPRENLAQTP